MPAYVSHPEDLALHGPRVLGFASASRIAARYGLDVDTVDEALRDFQARGWVRHTSFAGSSGWSLTDAGRIENEKRLAIELDRAAAVRGDIGHAGANVHGTGDARDRGDLLFQAGQAIRQGLKDVGFVEGQNLTIEYRYADNQFDRLPALAAPFLWPLAPVLLLGAVALATMAWRLRGPRQAFAIFLFTAVAASQAPAGH